MKVMYDGTSDYILGPIQALDFKDIENEKNEMMFYYGIHPGYRMARPINFKHNIYFETEEPNGFVEAQLPHQRGNWDINFWTKVINICPFTAEWENTIYNTNKFTNGVYPFNPKNLVTDFEKKYSVCYVGGLHGRHGIFSYMVNAISKFPDYRYISLGNHPLATNVAITNQVKFKIWAQTKITVCANLLSENAPNQYNIIRNIPNWEKNRAFSHLHKGFMPQMKPRITDAAISKSLILILRDPWNVIETWFKPNEHFLYIDSLEQTEERIKWCLDNWDYCKQITENMYNEYMNQHSIQKFYEKHLKEYDI